MFVCGLCNRPSKPKERMFKVPDRASNPPTGFGGPQIQREAKLCPRCAERYVKALKEAAPDVNPQSAYAALVE